MIHFSKLLASRSKEIYMPVSLPWKSVEMFLRLWLELFPEIFDIAMLFVKKNKTKQTNLKYYILLGLVGRHFTPYALVFQLFFIYLFFLKKWKLTNIENNTLINIRQHRQKAFATLSRSWLFRGWGRGGWVNPLKKNTCGENHFYR